MLISLDHTFQTVKMKSTTHCCLRSKVVCTEFALIKLKPYSMAGE